MNLQNLITVVGAHAEGESGRVITGGVLPPSGKTIFEKMRYLERESDWLRQMLLFDPRGGAIHCMNLLLPPCDPRADIGLIIMESDYYVPMSGSNMICAATVALETGMLPMQGDETKIVFDTPGGLVSVLADTRGGKCRRITFENVPCFVFALGVPVEVPGLGTVTVDAAYGGMIYALVDAQKLGFSLDPSEARDLVSMGETIKRAAAAQIACVHPENPEIHTINQTLFAGPLENIEGGLTSKNAVIVSPGRIDRSPCGTGTSARLAVLHAKGLLQTGEKLDHVSIINTHFEGRILGATRIAGTPGVNVSISGRAWLTGVSQYGIDPEDPLPHGHRLADTWFG
jgi:proline racemase